jgi:hypothetical protein
VPEWLPPSVSVHRADGWKLIRVFHGGDNGAHRYLLFNLLDDIGETNNLADQHPQLVRELDALIERFLVDTHAVTPQPNPAFDPTKYRPELEGMRRERSKQKTSNTSDDQTPELKGWKPRGCTATVGDGVVTISEFKEGSFLGFAAGKHSGPSTVRLRIKAGAGSSHVDWLPDGPTADALSATYQVKGDDWEEITVNLSASGRLGVVRVYFPAERQPIEIDWIEIRSEDNTKPTRTEF